MALFSVDEDMNISIARGYTVDIPVTVRKADSSPYEMIPGQDRLIFTVKTSVNTNVNSIQVISEEPSISIVPAYTVNLTYGQYVYDLVLEHAYAGEEWSETILGPRGFYIGGDDDQALDAYRKLLTSEYKTRPKLTSWLLWLLSEGLTYNGVIDELVNAFILDTAVGAQLDVIGRIVGVERLLNFYPSGGESPLMDDDTYRTVIKARIVQDFWKGTLPELYEAWGVLFPDIRLQVQDLQDMTYNVVIIGAFSSLMRELIVNGYIVPKPEGVRIALITITDMTGRPLFAYDLDDLDFSGYTAHWATLAQ